MVAEERADTEWLLTVFCENCNKRFILLGDASNGTSVLPPYIYVAPCPHCHHLGQYHTSIVERLEHQLSAER